MCCTFVPPVQQMQEANLVKRQSALLMNSATEDDRIAGAFKQLEDINEEVSQMKTKHAQEVSCQ